MKEFKIKTVYHNFLNHMKQEKATFCVYLILRIFVVLAMIAQLFNQNYENVFLCVLTLFLLLLPNAIEMNFRIKLPTILEIIILVFIFAAEILGEINEYYIIFPFWDDMLHTINGFLAAAIGFSLVDILNRTKKITFDLAPFFVAMVAFCFSMTIGVMWEFFEFGMDNIFNLDMQKDTILNGISTVILDPTGGNKPVVINGINQVIVNGKDLELGGYLDIGLIDTMKDLIVNFIGAIVFSIIGYFYLKKSGNVSWTRNFIVTVSESNSNE